MIALTVYINVPLQNVRAVHSHRNRLDMVDSTAARGLGYPVQSSDSTDIKYRQSYNTDNENVVQSLDSGFSRSVSFFLRTVLQ